MLASYPEQFHPGAPEQPLADTVNTRIARTPPGYAMFRKDKEWGDNSQMPTHVSEASIWHLLLGRQALLRSGLPGTTSVLATIPLCAAPGLSA